MASMELNIQSALGPGDPIYRRGLTEGPPRFTYYSVKSDWSGPHEPDLRAAAVRLAPCRARPLGAPARPGRPASSVHVDRRHLGHCPAPPPPRVPANRERLPAPARPARHRADAVGPDLAAFIARRHARARLSRVRRERGH